MNPATTRPRAAVAVAVIAITAMTAFGLHHLTQLRAGQLTDFQFIVIAAYLFLVYTSVIPFFHRDIVLRPATRWVLAREFVLTIVPAHNEDRAMFQAMLRSVGYQTRLPDRLHIVENGDPAAGYRPTLHAVVQAWQRAECPPGLDVRYSFNPVPDKRSAQVLAIDECPQATIHMTLDSDCELGDEHAIERGIAPFARRRIMSVCGFLVGKNHHHSLLTRLVDIGFVGSFLNGRASQSMIGSVTVNTGGLAYYRASVIRKYRDHYLNHRIFGRKMSYGDDAMWTRYAMLEGDTVFQRSSWAYTLHPQRRSHLAKQRTRWHRSFFWGNLWMIRNFSPRRPVWWLIVWQFVSFVWFTAAIPSVLIVTPIRTGHIPWMFGVWFAIVSYLSTLSYLTVRRPDMSFAELFGTWLLAPLASVLNLYLGWWLRYVGMFTCLKTSWSTREQIEVGLGADTGPAARGVDWDGPTVPVWNLGSQPARHRGGTCDRQEHAART